MTEKIETRFIVNTDTGQTKYIKLSTAKQHAKSYSTNNNTIVYVWQYAIKSGKSMGSRIGKIMLGYYINGNWYKTPPGSNTASIHDYQVYNPLKRK